MATTPAASKPSASMRAAFAAPAGAFSGRRRRSSLAMCSSSPEPEGGLYKKPIRPPAPQPPTGAAQPAAEAPKPTPPAETTQSPDVPEMRRPPELEGMLTDSQERRLGPVRPVKRAGRGRKKRGTPTKAEELDWDKMTKRRIVSEEGTYVKLADVEKDELKKLEKPKELQVEVKDKLRKEVVQPYKQNWILVAIAAVGLLVLLYAVLPTDTPVIRIPDL